MKKTLLKSFFTNNELRKFVILMKNVLFIALLAFTHVAAGASSENSLQSIRVTGVVTDAETGETLPGVSIMIEGTTIGTTTDIEGNYNINAPDKESVLSFSFVGYQTERIVVGERTVININLLPALTDLEEVVVIGYGTQRKINLTGAVASVGSEEIENRPVTSAEQALQGVAPGLQITTSRDAGEVGGRMDLNIRGLTSLEGSSNPYILVDGIPMSLTDINPQDIESVTILKDVASASIYGARAAYGVILITTKRGKTDGKVNISYSNNFAAGQALNLPNRSDAITFANVVNYSFRNQAGTNLISDEHLGYIEQNMKSPGSAPEMYRSSATAWRTGAFGLYNTAAYDWDDIFLNKYTNRTKHDLNISGGHNNLSFFLSAGLYDEGGLLKPVEDKYSRYNLSATINSQIFDWLEMSFLTKYRNSDLEYPTSAYAPGGSERAFFITWMLQRVKPTASKFFPGTEIWTGDNRMYNFLNNIVYEKARQTVVSPRVTIEPIKGWVTNIEFNYTTNDRDERFQRFTFPTAIPKQDGSYDSDIIFPATQGSVTMQLFTNSYMSPNIYSTYVNSFGQHNFSIMAGYQQETYTNANLRGDGVDLLTRNIPAIRTTVGRQDVSDALSHWSSQGYFGRLNYNFAEKYLLEVNARYDGTSRFAEGERWGFFPSVSGGWVASSENFFPLKNIIDVFKLRASYGSIGNQNVGSYLYLPGMGVGLSNYLFTDVLPRPYQVTMPGMESVNLTWETVNSLGIGLDANLLNNRLGLVFDWYQAITSDLVGPGETLPSVLGAGMPKVNEGEVTIKGWEFELSWRNRVGDFSYGARAMLSDYERVVTAYHNPTKLLNTHYVDRVLGEIWGFETAGLFQTQAEIDGWHNQSQINTTAYRPGDLKYVDQDGDGVITTGENTLDNPGDRVVIGNTTPRYQFGISGNAAYKGFDMSFLIQGVGKRDFDLTNNMSTFLGPANGYMHAVVYDEHLDFYRPADDDGPLGPNTDAYFANPYLVFGGSNNKNYSYATERYLQNAAYIRLKNLQVGYTLPRSITEKAFISRARIYLSGENLWTGTSLMFHDPEALVGNNNYQGSAYPLSRIYSMGLNINF